MSHYFDQDMETASLDALRALQGKRLRDIVSYAAGRNALVRERMRTHGVAPEDIRTVEDIVKLPTMSKELLRETYPMGLLCVPPTELYEMHMSSGSTGTPIVMPYTHGDLNQWAECMARCLAMAGAHAGEPIQITPSFGLFNGGFGFS